MPELTGLFLGAGASYEIGMPLVWELTAEFKGHLTAAALRNLNHHAKSEGRGHTADVVEELASVIVREELHYEAILGWLETEARRSGPRAQEFHALHAWLVDLVYGLLYERHVRNTPFIERHIGLLDGIGRLAERNLPLWVFSLNHDLIVECLAATWDIPINCGFSSELMTLPRRDAEGVKIGELHAETMTPQHLEKTGLPFLRHGERGINLFKVHGALDVFAFRDGKELLRLRPIAPGIEGVIETLRIANEELLYYHPLAPRQRVETTNQITYADEAGEMQFLRRSLLAGANKFERRVSQVLPMKLLDHFRALLNHVSTLICIGYSFGDFHINRVIREWMEFRRERHLVIVMPGAREIPAAFLHLARQVTLEPAKASDYLDASTGIVRSRRYLVEKRIVAWARSKVGSRGHKRFLRGARRAMERIDAVRRYSESVVATHAAASSKTGSRAR